MHPNLISHHADLQQQEGTKRRKSGEVENRLRRNGTHRLFSVRAEGGKGSENGHTTKTNRGVSKNNCEQVTHGVGRSTFPPPRGERGRAKWTSFTRFPRHTQECCTPKLYVFETTNDDKEEKKKGLCNVSKGAAKGGEIQTSFQYNAIGTDSRGAVQTNLPLLLAKKKNNRYIRSIEER